MRLSSELSELYRASITEAGATCCDLPWCHREARKVWRRTAKELKAMRRKHKGATLTGEPESVRCHVHVPSWRLECYVPLASREAVKVAS